VPILKAEKPAIVNVKPEDKPKPVKGDIQQTVRLNKFGSVKPPPPSTKIPKSAVIMPGGGSNTGFSLDVQFGVDIDSKLLNNTNIFLFFKTYFSYISILSKFQKANQNQ